jgi:hypothetical protein
MALPNPLYVACFPLQEYFVNKDTGFPLANGYVEFFSDPAFTVPKDVYQQSYVAAPTETYTYTSLGSVLQLSSVGTFQDANGADIIPFLFPYTGTPQAPGTVQLYWIRVWSGNPSVQGSVLQFTRAAWPPNLVQSSSPTDVFESSQNLFTNPEFSIVNFVPDSGQTFFTINVSTTGSMQIAPGWSLSWAGTGTIKLTQDLIVDAALVQTNPSYALKIDVSAGVTDVKLTQRLLQSPRIFDARYLSVAAFVKSDSGTADTIIMNYVASNGATYQVLSGVTLTNNAYELLAGVGGAPVFITQTNNTDSPLTGYVDFTLVVPSARITTFTSFFGVTVQNASSLVTNVQQTNAQQTNATFWYYKDQLAYKPIPSYTLGWDFNMNPFQAMGQSSVTYSPGTGKSAYCADQTILFQTSTGGISVQKIYGFGIQFTQLATPTAFAMIQYLGQEEAVELLNSPLCVQLRGLITTGTIQGQINLYWTADTNLPALNPNNYSLVSSVSSGGAPTVGGGGNFGNWNKVNRSNLGDANFTLTTAHTNFSFAGWNATLDPNINTAKYFAIVVSFATGTTGQVVSLEYCSLQKGYIPTAPAAMNFGETLAGLQQYYEKSYNLNVAPGTITTIGNAFFGATSGGAGAAGTTCFYKTTKRAAPTWNSGTGVYNLALYSTQGALNNVYNSVLGDNAISSVASGVSNFSFTYAGTGGAGAVGNGMSLQWVADARYGIQN